MAAGSTDLIDVITSDHRAVEQVFAELDRGEGTVEHRKNLVDHVITELVRHSVAEELFLYPTVRRNLPNGDEHADHELDEHAAAEEIMKRLDGMEPSGPDYFRELRRLIEAINHHVHEEEHALLPELAKHCTKTELAELGERVLAAKKSAPTRPHPSTPDRPPANLILDPGVGLIDRMRDALSGRSH